MAASARRFRIEGGLGRSAPSLESDLVSNDSALMHPSPAPAPAPVIETSPATASILDEIRALKSMLAPLSGVMENLGTSYKAELQSVASLRSDISEIDDAIRGTKKELAAIKVGTNIGGVDIAALELSTVVTQTEAATNDILAAGEAIETMAGAIQSETTLEAAKALATDIAERVTIIYMACNFQDLSGQRVSRVVDTLNFIEGRIHKIIDAWGGLQALHDLIETELQTQEEERATEGSAALLTGPVPVNAENHVDQNEIDALFD